ncbi:ankyrin repeat domain-containing protein [Aspergillus homomorphus CBS 101889]|uniref:Ankyrin n=1 Tax=Aspergillus homomorphus (strain CBS 101889) TaxID=1450537 RepID=A0A395HYK2_ASPHC|nr:ankyrin [Aspergillus homomorphus CBS 101889]RAL12589.1 ankyrin [Aspergillus homomorphus CBS 101889]
MSQQQYRPSSDDDHRVLLQQEAVRRAQAGQLHSSMRTQHQLSQQQAALRIRQQQQQQLRQPQPSFGMSMNAGYYNDIPITVPVDYTCRGPTPAPSTPFDYACRNGPLSTLQTLLYSNPQTLAFLHRGLTYALRAGNLETAGYLLESGAPVLHRTPISICEGPDTQRIPLFELLSQHGWTPNTHRPIDKVLINRLVNNTRLLQWFLAHGFDPDDIGPVIGAKGLTPLELAAARGNVEIVRLLLDAGANIHNGVPLHRAAGRYPSDWSPYVAHDRGTQSEETDRAQLPVMELLVERGADVNAAEETQHMTQRYAIVYAAMAGAVERVRWLLAKGADPDARGPFGSAREYTQRVGWAKMLELMD